MKAAFLFVVLMGCMTGYSADPLTEKLQRGLFEEEANRNLDAAIQEYQSVVAQSDEQRKLVATALFRLGECYRKLGRTNEAQAHYQRILRDFSEQTELVQLSRTSIGSPRTNQPVSIVREDDEAQQLARWREQVRDNPDLVNKLELGPPLHKAVRYRHQQLVEFLLNNGADINGRDEMQATPLHIAVSNGRREIVELLIRRGAPVNARDKAGQTPLHHAANAGYLAIAQALIAASADMSLFDNSRNTPLMIAVTRSYRAMTDLLLARGANPDRAPIASMSSTGPNYDRTPLSIAVTAGNIPLATLLISNKADVNACVYWRPSPESPPGPPYTPLVGLVIRQGSMEMLSLLLESGADATQPDQQGSTPLMLAAQYGRPKATEALLSRRIDPDAKTQTGWTALHAAANSGNIEVIQLLLAAGAEVDARTMDGSTPLFYAVQRKTPGATKVLLEAGATPDVLANNITPLGVAQSKQQSNSSSDIIEAAREIADLLVAHGANPFFQRQLALSIGYRTNALSTVFTRGTNEWNRYTLLELLAPSLGNLRWGDWPNAFIERVGGRALTNMPLDLAALFNLGNCSNDIWLEWGDRIIVPELDHALNAPAPSLPTNSTILFTSCLPRTVQIVVKRETNSIQLLSDATSAGPPFPPPPRTTRSLLASREPKRSHVLHTFRLKEAVLRSGLLRASSDVTRVRIWRSETSWVVNLNLFNTRNESGGNRISSEHDLWLRDGDVIEIPEKE